VIGDPRVENHGVLSSITEKNWPAENDTSWRYYKTTLGDQ